MLILFNSESDLHSGERLLKKRTNAAILRLRLEETDRVGDSEILRVRNLDEFRARLRSLQRKSMPATFVLAHRTEFEQYRQTQAALDAMNVRLSDVLSSGQDQIFVLDREQRIVAFLGRFPDESPWKLKDLIGKRKRDFLPPQVSAIHEAATLRALYGEEVSYEWSVPNTSPAVHLFTVASPLRNDRNAIAGVMLVSRNVSALKGTQLRIETALKEKTNQLREIEGGVRQAAAVFRRSAIGNDAPVSTSGLHTLAFLSNRERSVLSLLGRGIRLRSIAQTLGISVETVRRHLKAMFRKTGVHTQDALVKLFSETGEFFPES